MDSLFDKTITDNRLKFKEILYDNGFLITATQHSKDNPNSGLLTVTSVKCDICDEPGIVIAEIEFENHNDLINQMINLFVDKQIIDKIRYSELSEDNKDSLIDNYMSNVDTGILRTSFKNINIIV